jgi:hypothetical protein
MVLRLGKPLPVPVNAGPEYDGRVEISGTPIKAGDEVIIAEHTDGKKESRRSNVAKDNRKR